MTKPSNLLLKLSRSLFDSPDERERFVAAIAEPAPLLPTILWTKPRPAALPFVPVSERFAWQPEWVDRLEAGSRPGAHELHDQGFYYCLDLSSVFEAASLSAVPPAPGVVFDMCAAPGGKSICAWRALAPGLLVANEVIRKRTAALISNFKRCAVEPAYVTSSDPSYWATAAAASADLVIVDAPCSGQSLLARGLESPGCFHPSTINMNANRQKRVLANAANVVAPGGYLAYMTCTYARDENEGVIEWLLKRFPHFEPVAVPSMTPWRSHLAEFPCYRMWPQARQGAGGFTVLLRSTAEGERSPLSVDYPVWKSASLSVVD